MKHHIIFKFIAILLCAAALLGAVAGGAGILVMTEANLYQKTAQEAYRETLEDYARSYAGNVAAEYASRELGGANDKFLNSYYGTYWTYDVFRPDRIGYVLKDAEGNVLQDQSLGEEATVEYSFSHQPYGNYMKVLSEMTEEEYHGTVELPEATVSQEGNTSIYHAIPEGGAEIFYVEMQFADGSTEGIGTYEEYLGTIYDNGEGVVEFFSAEGINLLEGHPHTRFTYLGFMTRDGQLVYEIVGDKVIQEGRYENGMTYLLLHTGEEIFVYDAIPQDGCAVTQIYVEYADGFAESAGGSPEIGQLAYDEEGNVCFTPHDAGLLSYNNTVVTHIQFHVEDALVYEARDPEGVGSFYHKGGNYLFRANPMAVPEESVPDVTEAPADTDIPDNATMPPEGTSQYLSDAVPILPGQGAKVTKVALWMESNKTTMTVESDKDVLGEVYIGADGFLVFRCDGLFGSTFETSFIRLYGENGNVLYEAYDREKEIGQGASVGKFVYDEDGKLIFTTDLNYGISTLSDEGLVVEDAGEDSLPTMTFEIERMDESAEETIFRAEVQKNMLVRETPNHDAPSVGVYNRGNIVNVHQTMISEDVTWAQTDSGWVRMDQLVRVEVPVPEESTEPAEETEAPEGTVATEPVIDAWEAAEASVEATSLYADVELYRYYDSAARRDMYVEYVYEPLPEYTVEVALAQGAFQYEQDWVLIRLVYAFRDYLIPVLAGSLLLFAVFAVYLCCAAAKRPGTKEIRASGLNAMPLELYAFIAACGVAGLAVVGVEGTRYLLRSDILNGLLCASLCAYGVCLLVVAFCFACAAQFKTPGGYWWRNSLTGRCVKLLGKGGRLALKGVEKLDEKWDTKLWPGLKRLCKGIFTLIVAIFKLFWKWTVQICRWLERLLQRLGKAMNRFFSMLPLTWQWLLVGFGMFLLMAMVFATNGEEVLVVICIGICISIILYGAHCFGSLLESAKRMSKGDLEEKVDDKLMVGSFKDFAEELNGLADVAVVAAQKQLRSERMKTELITNVSHDIKTPLTSIINYVDLLQKPHTDADQEKYLEVLDRQSQRLKKLIDDLMEMSKASTGNMSVDITRVDAAEAVNQALGEFADKLEKARLYPVFRQPEKAVYMLADGRLVWRVMSNLLSNAVKYALPGTRLYVDLQKVDSKVIISMKNISREELNVEADELLERFVRGDASRNTEGSGLGLNIAQSLMELQKGQLQILVDGDLFKVTLIFPGE